VLVHPQRHLGGQRLRVKAPRLGKRPLDQLARHAVVDEHEEPDRFQRIAELPGDALARAGLAGKARPHVDHGDHGAWSIAHPGPHGSPTVTQTSHHHHLGLP
jgi:hypothetical protein